MQSKSKGHILGATSFVLENLHRGVIELKVNGRLTAARVFNPAKSRWHRPSSQRLSRWFLRKRSRLGRSISFIGSFWQLFTKVKVC